MACYSNEELITILVCALVRQNNAPLPESSVQVAALEIDVRDLLTRPDFRLAEWGTKVDVSTGPKVTGERVRFTLAPVLDLDNVPKVDRRRARGRIIRP